MKAAQCLLEEAKAHFYSKPLHQPSLNSILMLPIGVPEETEQAQPTTSATSSTRLSQPLSKREKRKQTQQSTTTDQDIQKIGSPLQTNDSAIAVIPNLSTSERLLMNVKRQLDRVDIQDEQAAEITFETGNDLLVISF